MAEETATVESYESTLKEVVNGKRLSASKMTRLTEIAMQLVEHDTQLVSILYRTHKALTSTTAKISSLYAFDALCRAARSQVVKKGLTSDSNSEKGNEATFLSKVEGVLEGLVQDMISTGSTEAKEKTKKILDIWTKSSTFPANVLKRLAEQAKVVVKEAPKTTTSDPRASRVTNNVTPPPAAATPPSVSVPTPDSAQQALLALLTSAAANGQTPANIANVGPSKAVAAATPPQPQLDPLQVALLQQLANKVNVNVGNVPVVQGHQLSSSFGSASAVPYTTLQQNTTSSNQPNYLSNQYGSASSPPSHREYPNTERRDPRLPPPGRPSTGAYNSNSGASSSGHAVAGGRNGGGGPSRGYDRTQERDDYDDGRRGGPHHGGSFRGRGGRFSDRERNHSDYRDPKQLDDRNHDRGGSPLRRKRSRSRSPQYRDREDERGRDGRDKSRDSDWERHSTGPNKRGPAPYSPPHRPSLAQLSNEPPQLASNATTVGKGKPIPPSAPGAPTLGKDEFGRDIRQGSEEPIAPTANKDESGGNSAAGVPVDPSSVLGQATNASIVQNGSASTLTTQISPDELSSKSGGLDAFDFASFNPMLPASWVALGKAFEVSNGYTPSQEELMMMISGGMMAFAQMQGVGGMGGTGMNGMQTEQGMNGGQWGDSGQEWNTVGGRGRGFQHRGRSGFRGRGGGGLDGGYQYQQQQWGSNTGYNGSTYGHAAQETDAVVLGGASDAQSDGYCDAAGAGDDGPQSADDTEALGTGGTGGTGGSMRKVGDKWIFVRNSDNGSS